MNQDRHFYLYAKYHYQMTDMVEDLSVIYRKLYLYPEESAVPLSYIMDVLSNLANTHIQKNPSLLRDLLDDILPENTWRHGYITTEINSLITNTATKPYNVKIAIISKLLSILRLESVKDIPFELGVADGDILPLKKKEA